MSINWETIHYKVFMYMVVLLGYLELVLVECVVVCSSFVLCYQFF